MFFLRHFKSLIFISMLVSLQNGLFLSGLPIKSVHVFLFYPMLATYPAHYIVRYFIISGKNKFMKLLLSNFPLPH